MGAPAGTALATVAFLTVAQLPDEQFLSWGWRIPFLLSAALVVVGLFIRLTIGESPEFVAVHEHKEEVKLPIKIAFQKYWRQILLVAGIYFSQGIFAYICISYFVSYATAIVKLDRTYALLGVFVAGIVAVALYGYFGSLSDRIGRKTTYMIGAVAMGVSIWPAVALINTGNPWLFATAIVLVFGVAMAPAGGATGSLFSLMFGAEVRYTGVSVGYTLSQITGSAFAPLIAVALYGTFGNTNALVIYLLAASAVSIVSLLLLPGPWGRKEAARQLNYAKEKSFSHS
jgi:MFS family permease